MIEIKGLSKQFSSGDQRFTALKDVNLQIEDGDVFGIIGISGAGKSTFIRCINLLEQPTEGSILIDGRDVTGIKKKELLELRRHIGMVFQKFNLLMQRTILENVMLPLEIEGVPKKERKKKAEELLEMVGLADQAQKYPAQLSGGQQQRDSIASAFAKVANLKLCDEPTSALDPLTATSILNLLKKINEELGVTVIIITHQIQVVKKICNRMAVIHESSIAEQGSVEEIFEDPKCLITRQLLGRVDWDA